VSDQPDTTNELVSLLRQFYTDAEAFEWLTSPQPMFDGAIALDMIAAGRIGDLVMSLQRMSEGVYL
jgi:hypothetical protein